MNIEELRLTVEKADKIFKEIKEKYQSLSGYLVFSSQFGQCNLTTNIIEILKSFPDMIHPSMDKEKGLEIIRMKQSMNELTPILNELEVKNDTFIEIRFNKPDLDLIFELQKENLISQVHTPQTKASIRIVLGTLEEIYNGQQ